MFVVLASTALLPSITGYGTVLFQVVVLGAWGIVAALTSGLFADLHHPVVWIVAAALNLLLFALPTTAIYFSTRTRWPLLGGCAIGAWLAFYLASLFALFPATDGP